MSPRIVTKPSRDQNVTPILLGELHRLLELHQVAVTEFESRESYALKLVGVRSLEKRKIVATLQDQKCRGLLAE